MKRPLLSLSVFSAVFFGIILFSIIFGGYSSLYRAQNRIGDAKGNVIVECWKRQALIPELVAMAGESEVLKEMVPLDKVDGAAKKAKTISEQINSKIIPEKKLIEAFEKSQVRLSQEIISLINGLKKDAKIGKSPDFLSLEKKFNDLEIIVFYKGTRYNKEARYFNTRKSIFPGFLVAKLFGLDQINYVEITTDLFKPEKLRS